MIQNSIMQCTKKIAKALGFRRIQKRYGVKRKDLKDFFSQIDNEQIQYVVLRWFEDLPNLNSDNDLDILVNDDDFKRLRAMTVGAKENDDYILFDIYPVSNQVANYSYYTPGIAKHILDGRVRNKNGVWVPNEYDYFYSLAYHALFHKGFSSGMNSKYTPTKPFNEVKHDFTSILKVMSDSQGLFLSDITMETIEKCLIEHDWAPPLDVYFRRSKANEWAYLRAQNYVQDSWRMHAGKVVFILRNKIIATKFEDRFRQLVAESDAIIEREVLLNDKQAEEFMKRTRGGDWGMYVKNSANAGLAKKVFVINKSLSKQLDPEATPSGIVEYDYVKSIKAKLRAYYRNNVSVKEDYHIMHTSDNGIEACYYETVLDDVLKL